MHRTALVWAGALALSVSVPLAAWAVDDQLVPGKFTMIKQGSEAKFRA